MTDKEDVPSKPENEKIDDEALEKLVLNYKKFTIHSQFKVLSTVKSIIITD